MITIRNIQLSGGVWVSWRPTPSLRSRIARLLLWLACKADQREIGEIAMQSARGMGWGPLGINPPSLVRAPGAVHPADHRPEKDIVPC